MLQPFSGVTLYLPRLAGILFGMLFLHGASAYASTPASKLPAAGHQHPSQPAPPVATSQPVSAAQGTQPTPPKFPPLKVRAVMPRTKQALVLDPIRGEHVVVRVGQEIRGLRVSRIDAGQVVFSSATKPVFYVVLPVVPLTAPRHVSSTTAVESATAVAQPLPNTSNALIDPYAESTTLPRASSGQSAPKPGTKSRSKRMSTRALPVVESPRAGEKPKSPRPIEVPTTEIHLPPSAKPPAPQEHTVVMARSELTGALADFTQLAKEIQLAREGDRIRVKRLSRGSFFYRLGLRDADLVVSVNGQPMVDLDAAARVYAGLSGANRLVIRLYRGQKRVEIQVDMKP